MDRDIAGRPDPRIEAIRNILTMADIPEFWYSINHPIEGRICIDTDAHGNIHVYTPERGRKLGEKVYYNSVDALNAFADRLELDYTLKLRNYIQRMRSDLAECDRYAYFRVAEVAAAAAPSVFF